MEQKIEVNGREYTFFPLQAFSCVTHLTRLKNIVTRGAVGVLTDVTMILDGIDADTLDKVIFPILKECNVVCITDGKKLATSADMNALYSNETLDEFFVVVAQVLKYNFEPLVKKTLARFGIDLSSVAKSAQEKAKAKMIDKPAE